VKKATKRFLKLDYTTTLVVGTGLVLIFSVGVLLTARYKKKLHEENDLKRPLSVLNLPYCNGQKLDLFVPSNDDKPMPLVIYIHGGGWQSGSKVGGSLSLVKPLVEKNFAVASINYRLSGEAKFPAQIQDVFCAIRFLRQRAPEYDVNTSKIGLIGISAGGHLAALAANASDQPTFTQGAYQETSSRVQAAISMSGVLDLQDSSLGKYTNTNLDKLLVGTSYNRLTASPSNYLEAGDPSQLVIYGTKDKTVAPSQSVNYAALGSLKGASVASLAVQNGNHNLQPSFAFTTSPNRSQIIDAIAAFFQKQLDI